MITTGRTAGAILTVLTLLAIASCGRPPEKDFNKVTRLPMEVDAALGWKPKPGYAPFSGTFLTGEFGIRMNGDEIVEPARGAILAVGDSFAAGSEVDNHETWPAQLERLVKIPVLNAACGAWGVDQIVLRVEQLAPTLKPALVVVGILDQDVLRNNYRIFGGGYKPYYVIEGGQLRLQGTPVPSLQGARTELGAVKAVLGHSYALDWAVRQLGLMPRWVDDAQRYDKVHEKGPEIAGLLMHRLAELGKQHGFKTLMMMQYGGGQIMSSPTRPDIVEPAFKAAAAAQLPAIDLYPVLRAQVPDSINSLYVMHDNGKLHGHMSATGNRLVARTIHERLTSLGWSFESSTARAR